MPSNIEIRVTAEIADLQTKFAVSRAETSAFTQELNKLARQAAQGGMTTALKADLDKAAASMLSAKQATTSLSNELKEKLGQGATGGFSALMSGANALTSALGTLGIAASAAGIVEFGKNALDAAASLQEEADKLGITVPQLEGYEFAARESGVSTDAADQALTKFISTLGGIEDGTGPGVKALADLKLTADDLRGGPMQALETVAFALDHMSDVEKKAAGERELFSRSGQDINAMVHDLAGGLDAQTKAAQDAGEALDPNVSEAAKAAKIEMDSFFTKLEVGTTTGTVVATRALGELKAALLDIPDLALSFGIKVGLNAGMNPGDILALGAGRGLSPNIYAPQEPQAAQRAPLGPPPPAPHMVQPVAPNIPPPNIQIDDPAKAREEADQIIALNKQLQDALVEGAKQTNDIRLALGQESLADFTAEARREAQAKYDAAIKGIEREVATGKKTQAEANAAELLAAQQLANEKNEILDRQNEKQQQASQKATSDFIKAQQDQIAALISADDITTKAGQSGANDRLRAALAAIAADKSAVDDDLDWKITAYAIDSQQYIELQNLKLAADKDFQAKHDEIVRQMTQNEIGAWSDAIGEIKTFEGSLVSDIFTKRQSLMKDIGEASYRFLESEASKDIQGLTMQGLSSLGVPGITGKDQAGGVLMQAVQALAAAMTANTVTTQATAAAHIANTAALGGASAATVADFGATNANTVAVAMHTTATASNTAVQSTGLIAWIENTAATIENTLAEDFAAITALNPFASGSDNIPFDMPAFVHQGEMIIPAEVAEKIRAGNLNIGNLGNLPDLASHNDLVPVDVSGQSIGSVVSRSAAFNGGGNFSRGGDTSIGGDTFNMGGAHVHYHAKNGEAQANDPDFQRAFVKVMRNMHRNAVRR